MSILSPISKLDYWFKGEDQIFQWLVVGADNETPQPLTGWTIEFRMAVSKGGASVLTLNATLIPSTVGLCRVAVASGDTENLAARTYWYTLTRTNAGAVSKLAHGNAVLQASVV